MRALLGLGLVIAAAGCGGRMHVRAEIPLPPELPVRVFPEIVVVVDGSIEEIEIADAIALHLAASAGSSRIDRIDATSLAARRASGALGPASVVIEVSARVAESTRPTWDTRPQTICGPWGCTTQDRTTLVSVPVVDAEVLLRVSEGRSDRTLQELRLREHEESSDPIGMRVRALARLEARVVATVDPRRVSLDVELEPVDDAEVRAALEAVRDGHPAEARRALERVAGRDAFAQRSAEERAKILFDLGQARRLEARASADLDAAGRARTMEQAEEAIRDAIRRRPEATYARALAQIEEERQAEARMRAIDEAASHNFALDRGEPTVPAPPPGYSETPPAAP